MKLFLFSVAIFVLSSCSYLTPKKYLEPPIPNKPVRTRTDFTEALSCFGRLTQAYQRPPLYIMSSKVEDATGVARSSGGEIPTDATPMLQSSVVGIGGQVYYVANYPVLLSNLFKLYGMPIPKTDKNIPQPTIYLDATISAYDRAIVNDDIGVGVDGEDGGLSVDRSITSSVVTVDLNLVKIPSMVMVQKVQSVNSLEMKDSNVSGDFDVAIFGTGIDLSAKAKGLAARHQAIRSLLDLGVIQTLGRYLTLPWWKCSPVHSERDPIVIESLQQHYRSLANKQRIFLIQQTLRKRGYDSKMTDGVMDTALLNVLNKFQQDHSLPVKNQITEDLFLEIALTIPENLPKSPPPIEMNIVCNRTDEC